MKDGRYVSDPDGFSVPYLLITGDRFTVINDIAVSYQPSGTAVRKGNQITLETKYAGDKCLWVFEVISEDTLRFRKDRSSLPENMNGWTEDKTFVPASDDAYPQEYHYSFDPHVISEEYVLIYGEGIKKEFFAFCDAILDHRETFSCASRERFHQLMAIAGSCFPLAGELVDRERTSVQNGLCSLVYRYDETGSKEKIASFREKVSDVIGNAVVYEEPDFIKAMELFTAVTRKDTYDDSYTLEDSLKLKTYRPIMEDVGIYQEIASEYIYYLLQVGIDAFPCSALNRDQSEAHEWVMVKLDGKYYHMDPTYATNYPDSLFFFGMDDIQREYYGDLPKENFTYAESDLLKREMFAAEDRRFEKFWLAKEYEIDHTAQLIRITETGTGEVKEYSIEEP